MLEHILYRSIDSSKQAALQSKQVQVDRLSDRKQKIVQSLLIKIVYRKQGSKKKASILFE